MEYQYENDKQVSWTDSKKARELASPNCLLCGGGGYDVSNWDNFPPICKCVQDKGIEVKP